MARDKQYSNRTIRLSDEVWEALKVAQMETILIATGLLFILAVLIFTDSPPATRNSNAYKLWRMAVLRRDNYTCQKCGAKGYLEAHHIKSWAAYPELRLAVSNGLTLCPNCHQHTDSYKYWKLKNS